LAVAIEPTVRLQLEERTMWWPFAKKAEPKEQGPSQWELDEARIAALRAWRAVGQEFEYLGRRMVVAKHYSVDLTPSLHFPSMRLVPEVHARYADDRGEVHTLVLSEAEVLALAHSLQPNVRAKPTKEAAQP
jgi:hypothetical protein